MKSTLPAATSRSVPRPEGTGQRERLLGMSVAAIIAAHPEALDVLIQGGFGPLANPVARRTLAHTVTLAQAFRIRSLSAEAEEALIGRLLRLPVPAAGGEDRAAP